MAVLMVATYNEDGSVNVMNAPVYNSKNSIDTLQGLSTMRDLV